MKIFFGLCSSLLILSISTLTGCTKEQDHYSVSPDIWHDLTSEQQQLIAQEYQQYSSSNKNLNKTAMTESSSQSSPQSLSQARS